jgi:2-succinyl-5-enolpyruvyl-6-hydroxy-3-cyclohexene-1-carboxylate synthase
MDFHLANSMAVRYVNFFQFELGAAKVFANRGTSGIDSSNGTAAGNAIIGDKPVVLLTGDLGFFYDRNAFFHPYDLSKLKIIVFNNGGGGIFRLIQGPAGLPELEQHFETRHSHSAKFTAVEYGFDYLTAKDESSLKLSLELVFKDNKTPKLLEIFTDPKTNDQNFNLLKKAITDVFISK